jgi:hypothetical protein
VSCMEHIESTSAINHTGLGFGRLSDGETDSETVREQSGQCDLSASSEEADDVRSGEEVTLAMIESPEIFLIGLVDIPHSQVLRHILFFAFRIAVLATAEGEKGGRKIGVG